MKPTFDELVKRLNLKENTPLALNSTGQQAIQDYHTFIKQLGDYISQFIKPYVKDPEKVGKMSAVQIVSTINSMQQGTEQFETMSRLDTLTNGGASEIDTDKFVFNPNDNALNYLDNKKD